MAVLDHSHTFQADSQAKPCDTFCVVQFVLFWVGFFALAYVGGLVIGMFVN